MIRVIDDPREQTVDHRIAKIEGLAGLVEACSQLRREGVARILGG